MFGPKLHIEARVRIRNTFGNEFHAYLGFSDQFLMFNALTSPSISFKYRHAEKDQISGFDFDNTGGKWISVIPDFSIYIRPNIIFSAQAEIPLYSYVDGIQLTPTYRLTTGLLLRILPKKNVININ